MTDPFELTDEDRAEAARNSHVPDRGEIRELLTRYFVGPIQEEHFERLTATFESERAERRDDDQESFRSPVKYRGYAWKEEVSENRRYMAPIDHLLLIGHRMFLAFRDMNGAPFPEPKLYCPDLFVGAWERLAPPLRSKERLKERIVWHLGGDGSFRSNDPDVQNLLRWCVTRTYDMPIHTMTFKNEYSEAAWTLYTVKASATELVGTASDDREFRLRRVK